ncbi:hypothetical protein H920_09423 [Fukomys damarensis]|uniref:Uncharacterized protein n=1 Tax=Fukomys damarensis TaxID=885580 RepID=A0A091DFC9_FUKDA|nr:hypothetical protein H920_09423 [Fukomys damarensis]
MDGDAAEALAQLGSPHWSAPLKAWVLKWDLGLPGLQVKISGDLKPRYQGTATQPHLTTFIGTILTANTYPPIFRPTPDIGHIHRTSSMGPLKVKLTQIAEDLVAMDPSPSSSPESDKPT